MAKLPAKPNLTRVTAYKPEYCALVIAHCEKGGSVSSFGGVVNVSRTTVQTWRKQFPDFDFSCDLGILKAAMLDEYALAALARGTGEGNHNALAYRLGNRLPDEWRTISRTEITGANGAAVATITKVELVAG